MKTINRREFLTSALSVGGLAAAGLVAPWKTARAATVAPVPLTRPLLVNITLPGGPDMRHLFMPVFDSDPASLSYVLHQAHAKAGGVDPNSAAALEDNWNNNYILTGTTNQGFGIHLLADWLVTQFEAGNVAIVNNAFASDTRDHSYVQLLQAHGQVPLDPNAPVNRFDRFPGLGGKLAAFNDTNVVAITSNPNDWCYSPSSIDPTVRSLEHCLHVPNSRGGGLYTPDTGVNNLPARVARALKSFYAGKRISGVPAAAELQTYLSVDQSIRDIAATLENRLAQASPTIPAEIQALQGGGVAPLNGAGLRTQLLNLHDTLISHDLLNTQLISMAYADGGWDTHKNQQTTMQAKLSDLFGSGRMLDTLYSVLPASIMDNVVFAIAGEFGRQIRANDGLGTDHGEGTHYILIGNRVNGGLYGDMFPATEFDRLADPAIKTPDIEGRTHYNRIFAQIAEWIAPGSSADILNGRDQLAIEQPGLLDQLLS